MNELLEVVLSREDGSVLWRRFYQTEQDVERPIVNIKLDSGGLVIADISGVTEMVIVGEQLILTVKRPEAKSETS